MKVYVKYFAVYRALTGITEEEIQLPEGATVKFLVDYIKELHHSLEKSGCMLVAVNEEFAQLSSTLFDGDTAAIFPPVSGG